MISREEFESRGGEELREIERGREKRRDLEGVGIGVGPRSLDHNKRERVLELITWERRKLGLAMYFWEIFQGFSGPFWPFNRLR